MSDNPLDIGSALAFSTNTHEQAESIVEADALDTILNQKKTVDLCEGVTMRRMTPASTAVLTHLKSPFVEDVASTEETNAPMECCIFIAVHKLPWDVVKANYKNREKMEELALDVCLDLDLEDAAILTKKIMSIVTKERQHQVVDKPEESSTGLDVGTKQRGKQK